MKSSIFWNIMPCSPLKVNQCFRETCHLHLWGQRISQTNQHEAGSKQSPACYLRKEIPFLNHPHISPKLLYYLLPYTVLLYYFPLTVKTILFTQMSISLSNTLCWQRVLWAC
jgi:hypothetical protein